ncbi:MAG: glycosyltransferase family 4 protein [Clostridia bacterium]|nr:glycosyltransferase family 4 protein [Clostridia bacterium]
MNTVVATDVSICVKNGRYYYPSQVAVIIRRYYEYFGRLTICGRSLNVEVLSASLIDVTDMIEDVIAIYSLEKSMLGLYNKRIIQAIKKSDLIICRCPGIISHLAADFARKYGKPYFAESMGCAWDAYWNHGILGKIVAPYVFFKMKQTVYHADYALYVTSRFLQERYPCKNESVAASNVLIEKIDEEVLKRRLEKINCFDGRTITLMTTAAVDVRYKGQEFVIKAIPKLNKAGIRVCYMLVGGGDQTYLKKVSKKCGVEDQVSFLGRRPLNEVFELLDVADIYIQPSLQEGLPRSVIEAMSRGCPVVGAKTAGIPELIDTECVVMRKSVSDIVQVVCRIANPEKMAELAKQNFESSKGYLDSVLGERRENYYQKVLKEIDSHI